jgi:hypothetical protein
VADSITEEANEPADEIAGEQKDDKSNAEGTDTSFASEGTTLT